MRERVNAVSFPSKYNGLRFHQNDVGIFMKKPLNMHDIEKNKIFDKHRHQDTGRRKTIKKEVEVYFFHGIVYFT